MTGLSGLTELTEYDSKNFTHLISKEELTEMTEMTELKEMRIDKHIPAPPILDPLDPFTTFKLWIEDRLSKGGVNESQVKEIVDLHLLKVKPRKIEVKIGELISKIEGQTHYQFELVLKAVASGVNLALTGSTATSKTTMAIQVAKALNKQFMLFKPIASPHELTGTMNATGGFNAPNIYHAHKNGMLAIFDENDASDPAAVLVLNSIIENKTFTYPNGETVYNPDFQAIFTMNTRGTGGDRKFVGRNRLDAATLDRFAVLEVEQDLSLEASLIGIVEAPKVLNISKGGSVTADKWLSIVRNNREAYSVSKPDKIVSMRATRDGWKLLQAGIGLDHVVAITIVK